MYQESVPEIGVFYKSSGYKDELVWGGLWLYRATGKHDYYQLARTRFYSWMMFTSGPSEFSWDDKRLGVQLLIAQVTRGDVRNTYIKPIMKYCMKPDENKNIKFTPKGLLYVNEWAPLRYAANSAFLCIMASEYTASDSAFNFAKEQSAYILGEALGKSFVIGFGDKYPKNPHHRASSCPTKPAPCGKGYLESNRPNPQTLYVSLQII
jgi:endoglucanase